MLNRKYLVYFLILALATAIIFFICAKRSFFIENYIFSSLLLIAGVSDIYLHRLEKLTLLGNEPEVKNGSGFVGYLHLAWAIFFILVRPFQLFSDDRWGYILSIAVAIVAGIPFIIIEVIFMVKTLQKIQLRKKRFRDREN